MGRINRASRNLLTVLRQPASRIGRRSRLGARCPTNFDTRDVTTALADPQDARASPQVTRADRKRIKELERELLRKDRALAETAALLVLSKKVSAIFNTGEDE